MDKIVKAILFKNDLIIISEIVEVMSDIGEPDCKLINPYQLIQESVIGEYELISWPKFTFQNEIMVNSESILTITDPKPTIIEKYLELTA